MEGKPEKVLAERAYWLQSAVSMHIHAKLTGREECSRDKKDTSKRDNFSLQRIVKQNLIHKECIEAEYIKSHHAWMCPGNGPIISVIFLVSSHSWTRGSIRSILLSLKRKITGLLLSGVKCESSQYLEEEWGATESKLLEVQWSFSVTDELGSSASVDLQCLIKSKVISAVYQDIL